MATKVAHTVEFKDSFGVEPDSITAEPTSAQSLDYLRMDNEVSMEEVSVLSTGAWVELDDCNECGECPSEDSAAGGTDLDDLVASILGDNDK